MSSDLKLLDSHLETHWNGKLVKMNYKTLRERLELEPIDDYFAGYELPKIENPIPLFVIRRLNSLEIEWEDGLVSTLKMP